VVAGELRSTSLTLSGGRTEQDQYLIEPFVDRIDSNGKGTVSVSVRLVAGPFMGTGDGRQVGRTILASSFSAPFGQTMVLGSGATSGTAMRPPGMDQRCAGNGPHPHGSSGNCSAVGLGAVTATDAC